MLNLAWETPNLAWETPNLAWETPSLAWEADVWVADAPAHLIHLNGVRFLGPYPIRK
jgi:hypothetical protein